ncbi:MAG: hypothetical protein Kow00121_67600 [Elainellaceae cyanobacterium]
MQKTVFPLNELDPETREFYCRSLRILQQAQIPFLVGGAYAFERYTGIARDTKDIDLFVHLRDRDRVLQVFSEAGYDTEIAAYWLAKVFCGNYFVDFIVCSANGGVAVDDQWFEFAVADEVLDLPVLLCPAEEMLWSKAFIMSRDRYDGADVAHLLLACSEQLNWSRLLERFGDHWRVLFSHLLLFGFIYPSERSRIPDWVMNQLWQRLSQEMQHASLDDQQCQGTLLAPLQYQIDVEQWGYQDARLKPVGTLTEADLSQWTTYLEQEKS